MFSPFFRDKVNDKVDGSTGGGVGRSPLRGINSFVRMAFALQRNIFFMGEAFVGMLTLERFIVEIAPSLLMKSLFVGTASVGMLTSATTLGSS